MVLTSQRRLAAQILKVGESRVWIDPDEVERVSSAITREEMRRLIHEGVVVKLPKRGISRGRKRVYKRKRRAGRRRGPGSAKGPGRGRGQDWISRIRVVRRRLRELRDKRQIVPGTYRKLILMAKGGAFRSTAYLDEYIEAHKLARRR